MNKEIISFQNLLKEAYDKGENEQTTIHELVEYITLELRALVEEK